MATKIGFSDDWPKWAKPTFALAVAAMWIGGPMVAAWNLAARTVQEGGVVDYQPILVVLVGMTTVTITGVFVFMTFRIDRGTKRKARGVAKKALKKIKRKAKEDLYTMEKKTCETLSEMIEKSEQSNASLTAARESAIQNFNSTLAKITAESDRKIDEAIRERMDEGVTPERVREEISARITEEVLRRHIEAVLMVTANGQIVAEYAKEHADVLDSEAFKQLIHLLDDSIRPALSDRPAEHVRGDAGWFGRMRARLTR